MYIFIYILKLNGFSLLSRIIYKEFSIKFSKPYVNLKYFHQHFTKKAKKKCLIHTYLLFYFGKGVGG
jgi:hypothetical protein